MYLAWGNARGLNLKFTSACYSRCFILSRLKSFWVQNEIILIHCIIILFSSFTFKKSSSHFVPPAAKPNNPTVSQLSAQSHCASKTLPSFRGPGISTVTHSNVNAGGFASRPTSSASLPASASSTGVSASSSVLQKVPAEPLLMGTVSMGYCWW